MLFALGTVVLRVLLLVAVVTIQLGVWRMNDRGTQTSH